MCDLKTAFFRFCRWAGKVLRPQTDAKTVFRYERAISRECRPRPTGKGKEKDFSPEICPAIAFRKPFVFLYTFGRAKRAVLTAEKALFSFRKIRMPLSRTPPLYSSSFTYSIRSAGWQSKREQITSSVPHDGI